MTRATTRREHHIFRPGEHPDVEVVVNGLWCDGQLRVWTQREDGSWHGDVEWRADDMRVGHRPTPRPTVATGLRFSDTGGGPL